MKRLLFFALGIVLAATLSAGIRFWLDWTRPGPAAPSGGLYFPWRVEIPGPHFAQADPAWGADLLGNTPGTLAAEGCAVASAAMALGARGVDTDPGRLNHFLTKLPGGYTENGWIYWEKATEIDPARTGEFLPHYENSASHFLIDSNLLKGNPVIARLRYPSGLTHFVLIVGKSGTEYLIRDPGRAGSAGVYPLKEFGGPIEAIRFYRAGW